jgi:isopropylmalate/homocitrate/citramalate synthase
MGSQSDWATLENTANMLKQLGVPFEAEVVSAHRTPDRLFEYAETARDRGIQVIIAGAGIGSFIVGNNGKAIKGTLKALPLLFRRSKYTKAMYMDLLALLSSTIE